MNNFNNGWVCPNCGRTNKPEALFCAGCGTSKPNSATGNHEINVVELPKKKSKWPIILASVLVLALAAGAAFFLLNNKDDAEESSTADSTTETTVAGENPNAATDEGNENDDANKVNPNAADPSDEDMGPENTEAVSAKASSVRAPIDNNSYDADKAIDNSYKTAWVEGISGEGIGESLSLSFDNKYPIEGIYIANGYQKSESTYNGNYRVKELLLRFGDGSEETCILKDYKDGGQIIVLSEPKDTSNVTLEIVSAYAGDDEDIDTCITEVRLADKTEIEESKAPKIKAKAK